MKMEEAAAANGISKFPVEHGAFFNLTKHYFCNTILLNNIVLQKGSGILFSAVTVHPRVHRKRPEISDGDAIHAWQNAIAIINRAYDPPDYYAAAGMDTKGRMLELVGVELEDDTLMIFHAMKLSEKMRKELGL